MGHIVSMCSNLAITSTVSIPEEITDTALDFYTGKTIRRIGIVMQFPYSVIM